MADKLDGRFNWDEAGESGWIDISIPVRHNMVHWPGDSEVEIVGLRDTDKGDTSSLMSISFTNHCGTHVDAPHHFIAGGSTIDKMLPDATVGRARVIESKDKESIKVEELIPYKIQRGERILFKTAGYAEYYKDNSFYKDFVYIHPDAARYLVERGIRAVGIDYLSAGSFHQGALNAETHKTFLNNGVYIIEGLDLSKIKPGRYDLVCLPLLLEGGDGSPARAMLKPV
ncbi:cyclase family protein [Chloroflexota bacterium]